MKKGKKAIIFIFYIVSVIFIFEIFFRIYFRNDYGMPTHRNYLFKRVWDEKYGNLNSLGHRDHEFTVKKPPGTFRILAIGDSLTYGEGVKNIDDIFTEKLESKLNSSSGHLKYEVLNVSRKGWNVNDYISALKSPGLSYEPDLLMIGFYVNDIDTDSADKRPMPLPAPVHEIMTRLSYLYFYTYSAYYAIVADENYWSSYYLSHTSPDSSQWQQFVPKWKELIRICNNKNIRVLVVILPNLNMFNDKHPFIPLYRNVEKISQDSGADVINLFPFVDGYVPRQLHTGITDGHPNELAHSIYADRIFEFISSEKIVDLN